MRRAVTATLLFAVLAFLISLPAQAQRFTGTINGTVTDNTDAVVPDAEVKVTEQATGQSRTASTDGQGNFAFPQLPIGTYTIEVTKDGFAKAVRTGVTLHVADSIRIPVQLQVGAVTQEMTIESSQIMVNTETGEIAGLVTGQQVRGLPLNGRNFVQLTQLMPGVSAADNLDPRNKGLMASVDMSVSGGGATNNLWLVDGANNNDVGSNRTILIYPSVDNIAEFKIHRNSYGAEFGQASGGTVNVVTRSGSNTFHGSAYYFGRNDVFNARNYFLRPEQDKEKLRWHGFGYTLGGPIARDKVFFFWSQEWNIEKRGTVRTAFVPTAAQKQGDFSTPNPPGCLSAVPNDPLTGAPFPGDMIPPDRISPGGQLLMQLYPDPNVAIDPSTCVNWVGAVTTPIDWRQESIRGDINITPKTSLMLRYTQDKWFNDAPNGGSETGLWGDDPFPAVDSAWNQPAKQFMAKLTNTIGTTAVNSFQFSYSGNDIITTRGGTNPELNDQINAAIQPLFGFGAKSTGDQLAHPVFWGGGGLQALWAMAPWTNNQDLFVLKDDFSKVMGSHTLKFGALYSWNAKNEFTQGASAGEAPAFWGAGGLPGWGATTGNLVADFMLRDMTWGFNEFRTQPEAQTRWRDFELYLADSWKVNRRLTLDLGLRYSFLMEPFDNTNNIAVFVPSLFNPALGNDPCNGLLFPITNPCTAAGFAGGATTGVRSLRPSDKNNFAPRLGFAYDLTGAGRYVIRGGIGQYFQRERLSPYLGIANNPPFTAQIVGLRTLDSTAEPCGGCFSAANGIPGAGLDLTSQLPNTWQWNLTWEQELLRNTVLEVGYVGTRGIHLTSSWDANQVDAPNRLEYVQAARLGDGAAAARAALRRFPELGADGSILIFGRSGDSIYHSLQSQMRSRFGRGSHFQFSYTWSRLIDNALLNNSSGGLSEDSFLDVSNPGLERGPSELHRPHVFNASLVYLTPALEDQSPFVRSVFGDWEVASIVTLTHGAALTVYTGSAPEVGQPSGTGHQAPQRPMRVAGEPCRASGGRPEEWLNPNAFTLAGFELGGIGNSGRGICYGPGMSQVDLALYKNWNTPFFKSDWTSETMQIQFRVEAFNIFNKAQFRNVNTTLNATDACFNSGTLSGPGTDDSLCASNPRFGVDTTTTQITSSQLPGTFGVATIARPGRQLQFGLKFTF